MQMDNEILNKISTDNKCKILYTFHGKKHLRLQKNILHNRTSFGRLFSIKYSYFLYDCLRICSKNHSSN